MCKQTTQQPMDDITAYVNTQDYGNFTYLLYEYYIYMPINTVYLNVHVLYDCVQLTKNGQS